MNNLLILMSNSTSFVTFAEGEAHRLKLTRARNTCDNYRAAINALRRYLQDINGSTALTLDELTPTFVTDFEQWLRQRVKANTSSCYLRSLRTLYNRAVEQGLTDNKRPFQKVFTGTVHTAKRAVATDDVRRLAALALDDASEWLRLARDLFLFSLYACGMPFADLVMLTTDNITADGRITYRRRKTRQEVSVVITTEMRDILLRHRGKENGKGDGKARTGRRQRLFPVLKDSYPTDADEQRAYQSALRRYNRALDTLRKKASVKGHLSSYVARHTWASVAAQCDTPLATIATALGHASMRVTQVYIAQLDHSQQDCASRKVIDFVMGTTARNWKANRQRKKTKKNVQLFVGVGHFDIAKIVFFLITLKFICGFCVNF